MRYRRFVSVCTTVGIVVPATLLPSVAGAHDEHRDGGSSRIAFTRTDIASGKLSLWTARADGRGQRHVMDDVGTFPAWSPDRTTLVFDFTDDFGNQQIATVRPDGSRFRQLTRARGISEAADYAPDGRRIVFDRSAQLPGEPGFNTSLWVMGADGHRPRPLFGPSSQTFDVEPEFSPDGSKLTFARLIEEPGTPFTAAIFIADADGSDVRQLTPFEHVIEHPRWSPDGRRIIFNIEVPEDLDDPTNGIWEVRAAGGPMRLLLPTTSRLHGFKPDYSPDGRQILFGCFVRSQGQDDLCVMNANGRDVRNITRTPAVHENHPVWS